MQSASTSRVSSANELSEIAKQKAIRGQPTIGSRVVATPVGPAPQERAVARPVASRPVDRVTATPIGGKPAMGQATPSASQVQAGQGLMSRSDAQTILAGLSSTISTMDAAMATGWKCPGLSDATLAQGKALRDRLTQFLAGSLSNTTITQADLSVADQILACANKAPNPQPDTNALITVGAILVGVGVVISVLK